MKAAVTLAPVFFMVLIGQLCRLKKWITPEQKDGVNTVIFNILFPMMIFNILFTTDFSEDHLGIVTYVFFAFAFMILAGHMLCYLFPDRFSSLSPYLLTTTEGGNVALPLYTSIAGMQNASNTVVFDIAGSLICFVIVPILISWKSASQTSLKGQLKVIFTNSFVLATLSGILLNLLGIRGFLEQSAFWDLYKTAMSTVTAPIAPMILFVIGYNLSISKDSISPILHLLAVRICLYLLVIGGFFLLFPERMAEPVYMIAVLIYFTCPTGFGIPAIISPIMKDESEKEFASAFISVHMIITLIVYTVIVLLGVGA